MENFRNRFLLSLYCHETSLYSSEVKELESIQIETQNNNYRHKLIEKSQNTQIW